jgi:hypothetical protein
MIANGVHNWYASSKQHVTLVALVILAMRDRHQIENVHFLKPVDGYLISLKESPLFKLPLLARSYNAEPFQPVRYSTQPVLGYGYSSAAPALSEQFQSFPPEALKTQGADAYRARETHHLLSRWHHQLPMRRFLTS